MQQWFNKWFLSLKIQIFLFSYLNADAVNTSIYKTNLHLFFYRQSIFDPRPENCLVDGPLTSIF